MLFTQEIIQDKGIPLLCLCFVIKQYFPKLIKLGKRKGKGKGIQEEMKVAKLMTRENLLRANEIFYLFLQYGIYLTVHLVKISFCQKLRKREILFFF